MQAGGPPHVDSFVVSTVSRAPRIIERGTAHAAMIFTDLLRKENVLKRATSRVGQNGNGGGAGSDAEWQHGGGGSSTAGSEVALDAGTTSRADAFSLIYEETIDAVFAIESALEPLAGSCAAAMEGQGAAQRSGVLARSRAGYRRATACKQDVLRRADE